MCSLKHAASGAPPLTEKEARAVVVGTTWSSSAKRTANRSVTM